MTKSDFKKKILPLGAKLYNFARLLLRDDTEAEDAVQEVFIKLWNLRKRMSEYKNIEAFAMKITKNWCLDRIKLKKPVYIESYNQEYKTEVGNRNPHHLIEAEEQITHIHRIMEQLPEQQRLIIQLRDIEGYEYKEIAKVLDMNETNIRVNLSRARNKIKEVLTKIMNYGYS